MLLGWLAKCSTPSADILSMFHNNVTNIVKVVSSSCFSWSTFEYGHQEISSRGSHCVEETVLAEALLPVINEYVCV